MAFAAAAQVDIPAPRKLSPAEQAGVAAIVGYLERGPEAVFDSLSGSAPLRAVPHDDALQEISVRLGPAAGSIWRLETAMPSAAQHMAVFSVEFPSGADDVIRLNMNRESNSWRVQSIETSAESVPRASLVSRTPARSEHASEQPDESRTIAVTLALPALALAVAAVILGRRSMFAGRAVLAVSAFASIAGFVLLLMPRPASKRPGDAEPAAKEPGRSSFARLASLTDMRRALATGDLIDTRPSSVPDGVLRQTAELWIAQQRLQQDRTEEVRTILSRLPAHSDIPLAELLRARTAFQQRQPLEAVEAYERAMDLGPGTDALWLEAAGVLSTVGFDERAEGYLRRISDTGSRDPSLPYAMSILSIIRGERLKAVAWLSQAWQMLPIERAEVLRMAPLWLVLKEPKIAQILRINVADEPAFASSQTEQPLVIGDKTTALLNGSFLRILTNDSELEVPGGSVIAPANVRITDAVAWRREDEERAIGLLSSLRSTVRSAGALAQPALREQCLQTADILARRNRWDDVVALTEPLPPGDERVPLEITILRGEAFSRLGRQDDLRKLIADLVHNPALKRKKDPEILSQVAELLASADDFDSAIFLLDRAKRTFELPGTSQRIAQLRLENQLASAYVSYPTQNFEIRCPKDLPAAQAQRIGQILEAELKRLRAMWFPATSIKPITVDVLSWEDFRDYTGSEYILGLYTNKILIPIADVDDFVPEVVALMTHELAHALLAEATNNMAPRWFHEAFASRVEMNESSENAFRTYRDENFLTVALLDAVADGSPDPGLIVEAYHIGETTLRFIEAKYGRTAIIKMMESFRKGATTDAAVRDATGMTLAALDGTAREWGATQPALFSNSVIRYDEYAMKSGGGGR